MGKVMTVLGEVDSSLLGHVQPHEHVFCDISWIPNRWDFPVLEDINQMLEEVTLYKEGGGGTLVDVTPMACGRDPIKLASVSRDTGIHIVMGTSWYRAPYYPDLIHKTNTRDLTAILVDEITNGFEDSGIKPGIIGEIGLDKRWIQGSEERVFRASARASNATGLAITTHTPPHCALMLIDLLQEENVDPERIILGHLDNTLELDYFLGVLKAGCAVEFDLIGLQHLNTDQRRANLVVELVKLGYGDRILLSMDVYTRPQLKTNGGLGYSYLIETFLPRLRAGGVSEEEIELMTHKNPARLLEI
jgi:phosphotriesterase-related protein